LFLIPFFRYVLPPFLPPFLHPPSARPFPPSLPSSLPRFLPQVGLPSSPRLLSLPHESAERRQRSSGLCRCPPAAPHRYGRGREGGREGTKEGGRVKK
jgi:hypothetical protein